MAAKKQRATEFEGAIVYRLVMKKLQSGDKGYELVLHTHDKSIVMLHTYDDDVTFKATLEPE